MNKNSLIYFTALTVQFSSANYTDSESSSSISITLLLGGGTSSSNITVIIMPFDQFPLSAEGKRCESYTEYLLYVDWSGGKDYSAFPINATFTAGTTITTINIPIFTDTTAEDTETFGLRITIPSSLGGRLSHGNLDTAVCNIIDVSSKYTWSHNIAWMY